MQNDRVGKGMWLITPAKICVNIPSETFYVKTQNGEKLLSWCLAHDLQSVNEALQPLLTAHRPCR